MRDFLFPITGSKIFKLFRMIYKILLSLLIFLTSFPNISDV